MPITIDTSGWHRPLNQRCWVQQLFLRMDVTSKHTGEHLFVCFYESIVIPEDQSLSPDMVVRKVEQSVGRLITKAIAPAQHGMTVLPSTTRLVSIQNAVDAYLDEYAEDTEEAADTGEQAPALDRDRIRQAIRDGEARYQAQVEEAIRLGYDPDDHTWDHQIYPGWVIPILPIPDDPVEVSPEVYALPKSNA